MGFANYLKSSDDDHLSDDDQYSDDDLFSNNDNLSDNGGLSDDGGLLEDDQLSGDQKLSDNGGLLEDDQLSGDHKLSTDEKVSDDEKVSVINLITDDDLTDDDDKTVLDPASYARFSPPKIPDLSVAPVTPANLSDYALIDKATLNGLLDRMDTLEKSHKWLLVRLAFPDKPSKLLKRPRASSVPISLDEWGCFVCLGTFVYIFGFHLFIFLAFICSYFSFWFSFFFFFWIQSFAGSGVVSFFS